QHYWLQGQVAGGDPASLGLGPATHPLLAAVVALPVSGGVVLAGRLSTATQPWISDHDVLGTVLLPGTGFLELAIRAGDEVGCAVVEELTLRAPLALTPGTGVQVQVAVGPEDGAGRRPVHVLSREEADGPWTLHAEGSLVPGALTPAADLTE
ncbi:polyketide synthase dehydratase domain-containing protein, partial [Amycolatopsis sp. SID8362]|uniref:polyketide synthase dehydratase domain-containing protein n=1 Tax=Amycolatopsis sp. SID8362 TaxID=2690346 RepID=UPI00136880C0